MVFADPPSAALQQALQLLADGKSDEAETVVKKAAMAAKAKHGSGSPPLAAAYADIARLHLKMGAYGKAAVEFQHASKGPLPPEGADRRARLDFMYGFAEALLALGRFDEAEKVLRKCLAFARNLFGPNSPQASAANALLADGLLKAGKAVEAVQLVSGAYDALWQLGDALIAVAIPVRAEALKATGRTDNPFADLPDLPDELVTRSITGVLARAATGNPVHMRAVLADLLRFADQKYGDGHTVTCDALAAVAHHEARQGEHADATARRAAVRRSVWSFAVRRLPGGLLANLEVGFEPNGTIHLVPHVSREPSAREAEQLEETLAQAVDDLYARPAVRA